MTALAPVSNLSEARRFTCVAQLRSLLSHGEVTADQQRSDAALDMISSLREEASPLRVLRAFCQVRRTCEPVCYLILFRLRRWLESQIVVKVAGGGIQALDLSFQSIERVTQEYRRRQWEWSDGSEPLNSIQVAYRWKTPSAE